ncbi:RNA dependent RNA polymerase-domain-containing protein [Lasiosphaeris hirsuta]|uniref:RNA-dependent RNA polymerase n=1 Tax=Lasiosphaeris hirsuta TaxID=260670 RepID=A0AA40A7H7_9PEZI|nr:RNA dependent RNA polymerase-domain-containing protein [Lasiosphaeris hirsuta]
MEVFMHGLPPELTDRTLRNRLEPYMAEISIVYYNCEKPKGKKFGKVVFYRYEDGLKFLSHYGETPSPGDHASFHRPGQRNRSSQTTPRLKLEGRDVYCRLSDRNPPTELTLRSIKHEVDQRISQSQKPEHKAINFAPTELSCGYCDFVDETFTFVSEWTHRSMLQGCVAKFTKRNLILLFEDLETNVEVRISYQSISELVWSDRGEVVVILMSPPTFLHSVPAHLQVGWSVTPTWAPNQSRGENQRYRGRGIDTAHCQISNYCMVYRFSVPRTRADDFQDKILRIRNRELVWVTQCETMGILTAGRHSSQSLRFPEAVAALKNQLGDYTTTNSLPFGLLFQLQALVYNGYLHPTTVQGLAKELAQVFSSAKAAGEKLDPISIDAFKKLFRWIPFPSPQGIDIKRFEVDGIMEYLEEQEQKIRQGFELRSELANETQNLTRIFRATVSPTRITLNGPELESKNRILRKFPNHTDCFIRVQFCDEDGRDLFNSRVSLHLIFERFKKVLSGGIQIAGRVYKFLGFSHSSLRSHSVWLSAPFVDHNGRPQFAEMIIRALGDFDNINSTARRAARIGQAFSETPHSISLDDNGITVVEIPDIKRAGRVFSDGVGTISLDATEAIWEILPESKRLPTCFQIRWAGAKGMLSLDVNLPGSQICIRPSMEKFKSQDMANLEICDTASKPIPMVLNRQLIKILEDMTAPTFWFMDLQERELNRLRGITANVYNTASFLESQSVGEGLQLHKFLKYADKLGAPYWTEPFLRGAIQAIVLRELRLLKHKSRIPVRLGMTLFGVMDETGHLKEGEVYVTYDTMEGRHEEPPGAMKVIVTRSPALHPGDVQLAYNVVPPHGHPLQDLRNCVVFSKWGKRDLPSQLSGGDLDGDVFNVIWDPEIVDVVDTFPPADYPPVKPLALDTPITAKDMADFFIDFIKNDHLGVIATRHMILADQRETGTLDEDCKKLAELHSSAVDFSKSGRPVDLKDLPIAMKIRPDFLAPGPWVRIQERSTLEMDEYIVQNDDDDVDEGPQHKYYASQKLLGKLYRAVDEQRIWADNIRITPSGDASFWDRLLNKFNTEIVKTLGGGAIDWEHRRNEAERIRHAYEDAVSEIMVEWSEHPSQPLTELEVFVGFVLNKTGVQSRRQRDQSIKMKDEFDRISKLTTRQMRRPVSTNGEVGELDALELCLACVNIGCTKEPRPDYTWRNRVNDGMESFKVVAASALMRELNSLKSQRGESTGGGFVGVKGGHKMTIPVRPAPAQQRTRHATAQMMVATTSHPTNQTAPPVQLPQASRDLLSLLWKGYQQPRN